MKTPDDLRVACLERGTAYVMNIPPDKLNFTLLSWRARYNPDLLFFAFIDEGEEYTKILLSSLEDEKKRNQLLEIGSIVQI